MDEGDELKAEDGEPEGEAPAEPPCKEESDFLVVGIGASAGGLEAIGELIRHVPIDCMAFVVVQHLAPDRESVLPQLLARASKIAVVTATDGTRLAPNTIYVIPPNADLAVMQGVIHLVSPNRAHGPRLPIDYLFRSLAEDQGRNAVGIVLSGTGTDGTFGLEAIKAAGGLAFVQDPASAKYDGMPRSALDSGTADFCASPEEIGKELSRIARHPRLRPASQALPPAPPVSDHLGKLFVHIRAAFGTDLTHYKAATVERRIERRMTLHRIGRLEDYVKWVASNPAELRALYKDMLIAVTAFFRDPDAFEALKTTVFPRILEHRHARAGIRVWVPACSTGEEVYSLAICLLEFIDEMALPREPKVQIFGTDLDDDSIQHARRGIYPTNIELDVSTDRLMRFFEKRESDYQISRRVRDLVVFSRHDVLRDAPFSRIDLASCRNLLIYLQPAAQKKVLRIVHYALNPSGYLFLGTSETVGDAPELFSAANRKAKIYSKKDVAPNPGEEASFRPPVVPPPPAVGRTAPSLQSLADRKVLELCGPPGVIVNEGLEILHFRGHTGPYLNPTPGAASLHLLRIARFELHVELKHALHQALSERVRVTREVTFEDGGKPSAVELDVVPLTDPESGARCLLVLFHALAPPIQIPVVAPQDGDWADTPFAHHLQGLEHELAVTKDQLQLMIEERESAIEELRSANEELQSSNEELQSTNEELESSKEEMQSTNEELTTVNEELHHRMTELGLTNDDLHNVLAGVDNAVVIVGMDLRIRRYTAAAEKLFNLVPGDVGRSLGFLDAFFGVGSLEAKAKAVIESLSAPEEDVLAANQRWYRLKLSPYKTLDHSIRGALLVATDIDVRRRMADMTKHVGAYAERFLAPIGHPLLIVDRKMRVVWCNDHFLQTFQLSHEETVGNLLVALDSRAWTDPGLRARLEEVFASGALFRDHRMELRLPEVGKRAVKVAGSQIAAAGDVPLVLLSIEPTSRGEQL